MLFALAAPSVATTDDTAPEDLPYTIQGNVRTGGQPVVGATVTVTGPGYNAETTTQDNGSFRLGVPNKDDTWTLELVSGSLPAGVEAPSDFSFTREVTFGRTHTATWNFTLTAAERTTTSFADQFLARVVNGLNFGLMLALAAIGLSLVFGTTGLSNFAHGEMVTFGALVALLLTVGLDMSIWIALPVTVIASAAFGWGMDAGLWRPLRRKGLGTVQLMIVSIGLSLALRYIFQMLIGGRTQQLPGAAPALIPGLGPIRLSVTDLLSMSLSLVVILIFAWWLMRTRIGRATRAVSDNPSLAAASGIDVDAVVRVVWIVAAALAGLSGVLWAYFRPGIKWDMGTSILLLIFAAVTLGGLGTAFGALIGSLIVGLLVEVSTLWIPSDLKYVGALVVLIVVLLFRPQGILGRRERIG
ncbi:branched-chain amino acid ABC transporter permease [Microbacterium sp.]|uniref:branched-chain amino acid ABC transporter permease n=1 Tax=Microbacterium sp. TaxID=51671 RepID=UPI003A8B2CBE